MTRSGHTWFSVLINEEKKDILFVPDRIGELIVKGKKVVHVQRGTSRRLYPIEFLIARDDGRDAMYFVEGWHDFVEDNGIEIGDILDFIYRGDKLFKVLIWRNGVDITDSTIVISSDSSDNDAADKDDTEEPPPPAYLPDTRCSWIPDFEVTFTKPYKACSRMNVPLSFARRHFSDVVDSKPVWLWFNHLQRWKATLFVKRDLNQQIVLCNIRRGVGEMIRGERIKVGQTVVVQLLSNDPLAFKVSKK